MAKKESFEEFEAREIAEASAYVKSYVKKHPDMFKAAKLPNTSKRYDGRKFAKTVEALMEPFAKAVGKNYAR